MDLKKLGIRTVVTVTLGPFVLFCAWRGGYVFLALVLSIVVLGLLEFYDLALQKVTVPQRVTGVLTGIALCLLFYYAALDYLLAWLAAVVGVALLLELFRNEVAPILNVATTLAGVFYVAFSLGFLILLRQWPFAPAWSDVEAGKVVMLVFLSIWICDSAAYLLGSRFGRHKLFERVSPNKTVEGTVFGLVFGVATAYACQATFVGALTQRDALVVGALCGSLGQLSDLVESLFKRDARVKDSSSLIPGHGGILDRFDSEILVVPAVFFYLRWALA